MAPLPAFFKSTGSLCSPTTVATAGARTFEFTDFSDYSDFSQIAYHNRGHLSFDNNTSSSQMGSLSSNRASAVYIFWLWHAWVDDMWWDWDANCRHQNNGTTIKDAYDEPNGFTIATGTTRTLNINGNIFKVQGKIIVEPGATLIIENGQILEILDDYFTNQSCDIEVQAGNSSQPGGKLIVRSGAVIRGITSMGQNNGQSQSTDRLGNTIYPDNRVYYLCRWPGIKVYGVKTQDAFSQQHGRVLIDGSGGRVTIQRAHKAILSDEGGIIECKDVDFLDCITAVEIKNYLSPHDPNVNLSKFERTNFIIGDQITKYFTNDNMYMHYKHDFHDFKQVVLENIGTINFGGCQFRNDDPTSFSANHDASRGTGIDATDAMFSCHNDGIPSGNSTTGCPNWSGTVFCLFQGLSFGINSNTAGGAQNPDIGIQKANFVNNHDAINCGGGVARIFDNIFKYTSTSAPFPAPSISHHHFIECTFNEMTLIKDNTFTSDASSSTNVRIENNATAYNTKVMSNFFNNTNQLKQNATGVVCNGDNSNTEVECNTFNHPFNNAIKFMNGPVHEQGDVDWPAGNYFDHSYFLVDTKDIEIQNVTPKFIYWITPTYKPMYTNGGGPFPNPVLPSNDFEYKVRTSNNEFGDCQIACNGFHVGSNAFAIKHNLISIFPNPGSHKVNIKWMPNAEEQNLTGEIYNSLGNRVMNFNANLLEFDVSNYANGLYFIVFVKNHQPLQTIKFVKE